MLATAPGIAGLARGVPLCGHGDEHVTRITFLDGPNTGQCWCGPCYTAIREAVDGFDAGSLDTAGVAEVLDGLGATPQAIAEFVADLTTTRSA